jgi:hypothetical protein
MQYAVVPEHHKDGSYHFHVLMSGLPASMVAPARHGRADIYQKGRRVFNFLPAQSALGFTNFSGVSSSLAVGRYMGKYLTKSMAGASLRGVGFRRWMVSRGVSPAPETVHDVEWLRVDGWHHVGASGSGVDTDTDTDTDTAGGRGLGVWVRYGLASEGWVKDILSCSSLDAVPAYGGGDVLLE